MRPISRRETLVTLAAVPVATASTGCSSGPDIGGDHHVRPMVNAFVPEGTVGAERRVGHVVEIFGQRPYPA